MMQDDDLTGFSLMGKSFILRNLIWKNRLPSSWSTKNTATIKKFKNRSKLFEKTETFQWIAFIFFSNCDQLDISKTVQIIFFKKQQFSDFLCLGASFRLKKQTWKIGYQAEIIQNKIKKPVFLLLLFH
jgi:hypothetical protein